MYGAKIVRAQVSPAGQSPAEEHITWSGGAHKQPPSPGSQIPLASLRMQFRAPRQSPFVEHGSNVRPKTEAFSSSFSSTRVAGGRLRSGIILKAEQIPSRAVTMRRTKQNEAMMVWLRLGKGELK